MPNKTIMDVSRWQGSIDWDAVQRSGRVDGVMLKVVSTNKKLSKRADGLYIDPTFEANYEACKRLGIPVGVYYYTYATTYEMADAELALLRTALAGKTMDLPVCVDVEDNKLKQLPKAALTELAAYALDKVEQMGFYAWLYTYTGYKYELDMPALAKRYDVWLADYTGKPPKVSFAYGAHQYTSKASVPGVTGNVDLSHAYKDYAAIIRRKGLGQVRG